MKAVGVVSHARRLLVDHTRNGVIVALVVLVSLAGLGWAVRNRLPAPPRLRGRH